MLGFMDPAKTALNLERQEEDLGQTLGSYGLGPGFFINWPILGPSSLRGTVGMVGDGFIDPLNYLVEPGIYNVATRGYERVNSTSLTIGEYESLKKAALDPYVSLRDAYYQYRQNKIKK
jgi:phospholipid-binding lipoprotein MlaA